MKKRILSLICVLALCLGMLPTTAWAADDYETSTSDDGVTTYTFHALNTTNSIICNGDTVIDLRQVNPGSGTAEINIRTRAENLTITLVGDSTKIYPVDVDFGEISSGNTMDELPQKVILQDFRTTGEIDFGFLNLGEENTLPIEYVGTVEAATIRGRHTSGANTKTGISLTLTPNGTSTLNVDYLVVNTNLTLDGGAITMDPCKNDNRISVGKSLTIQNCKVTMTGDGTDRGIRGNNITIENSTLDNIQDIHGFSTNDIYYLTGTMGNSSIKVTNSTVALTGGIINAKDISITGGSTVTYSGSYDSAPRLGGLFTNLSIQDSIVTGMEASGIYPAVGVDAWSWSNWPGKSSNSPTITIDNSTVSARSEEGAAIGNSAIRRNVQTLPSPAITISSNSEVTAISEAGAGIGGGWRQAVWNWSGSVTQSETVTVSIGGSSIVRASSVSGAGIGSGTLTEGVNIPSTTNITISGTSDVTAASECGAGIGAGQEASSGGPQGGIPVDFNAGIGGWTDVEGGTGNAGIDGTSLFSTSPLSYSARSTGGLSGNTGTLAINNNPTIQAQSGVIAVSLTVNASQPMMEYTLDSSEETPTVTTPISRSAVDGTDSGPGSPSYDLRPGYCSLAFWPVAAGSYNLFYGSGDQADPLLYQTNASYSDTFPVSTSAGALNAFTVIRSKRLGGSVTLNGATNGMATVNNQLTANLSNLTPDKETSDVTYQWYKDGQLISGATSSSYTPTETGVYYCAVTGQLRYWGTVNSRAVTVTAVGTSAPAAPTAQDSNITADTITLDTPTDSQTYEYGLMTASGISWQEGTTFNDLTPSTEYSFVQREKDSGSVSAAASFTTKAGMPGEDALIIDYINETATLASGVSIYSNEECTTKITLDANSSITDYIGKTVYAQFDDVITADNTTVRAIAIPSRPVAPALNDNSVNKTATAISLTGTSGVTYALFSETGSLIDTQTGTGGTITFEGLSSGTTYVLKARVDATESSFCSALASLTVATSTSQTIGVTPGDNTYTFDGDPHAFAFNVTPSDLGIEGFTVKYYTSYSNGNFDGLTTDPPKAAGVYSIILSRPSDGTYEAFERFYYDALEITRGTFNLTQEVTVEAGSQSTVQIDIDEETYGEITDCTIDSNSSNDYLFTTQPSVSNSGVLTFQTTSNAAAALNGQPISIPVVVNTDSCKVTVTVKVTVTDKKTATVTVTQADGTYGAELDDPVIAVVDETGNSLTASGLTIRYSGTTEAGASVGPSIGKPTEPGTYTVTVTYEDEGYLGQGTASFIISKATPTGAPAYTPIFTTGKTLADANLTTEGGTFNTVGTVKWVDENGSALPNTTEVTANTAYHWLFTPTDTTHYTTLTGTLTLYQPSSGGGGVTTYPVTVVETEHGTVTVSPKNASRGTTVTVTVAPDEGYELAALTITKNNGDEVKFTDKGNDKFEFVMPADGVSVKAIFRCIGSELCPSRHLTDVLLKAWYHEAVDYVVEQGIMTGTSATTFEPGTTLSRAMVAQILYNLESQPTVTEKTTFTDSGTLWAAKAIAWAQKTGVVSGYEDNTFRPNKAVTREELAQMLYNYAKYKGYDLTVSGDLTVFPDGEEVSSWAETAMAWANGKELINGFEDDTLRPGGDSTRAQAASILMNFDVNLAN